MPLFCNIFHVLGQMWNIHSIESASLGVVQYLSGRGDRCISKNLSEKKVWSHADVIKKIMSHDLY